MIVFFKRYYSFILQLLVIAGFIYHFNLEEAFHLPQLFPIIILGFLLQADGAPLRRKYTLIGAALGACMLILSPLETLIILLFTLSIVSICNLSLDLKWRKLILIGVAGSVIWLRESNVFTWLSPSVYIILGSMFMFRLLVFLYELKFQKERAPFLTQVSYFLMVPNIIFPLFPVVDYKQFRSDIHDSEKRQCYERGVYLISKAVLLLFAYRLIYSYLLPTKSEVDSLDGFIYYISTSYLLTIRLAGIFHFSVGTLHLFGHQLPDIFNYHFFASGLSDLWKRLNTYWRAFMLKLYFNPLYFQLRHIGIKKAFFTTTVFTFLLTLFFHQYQTFWITGVFKVGVNDMVFWGFFGLVIALRHVLPPIGFRPTHLYIASCYHVLKVMLTFIMMSLLWSFWTSTDIAEWFSFIARFALGPLAGWLLLLAQLVLFTLIAGSIYYLAQLHSFNMGERSIKYISLTIIVLLVVGFNRLTIEKVWNEKLTGLQIQSLFHFTLNEQDKETHMAGYYDQILDHSAIINTAGVHAKEGQRIAKLMESKGLITKNSDQLVERRFVPLTRVDIEDISYSINSFGIRDKEYGQVKDKKKIRALFLGGSVEMGWSIPKEETFEVLLEERINNSGDTSSGIEILNFSVLGRDLSQHEYILRSEGLKFSPDYVFLFHHDLEWSLVKWGLRRKIKHDLHDDLDAKHIEYLRSGGNLDPYEVEVVSRLHERIFNLCKSNGITPILVMMPKVTAEKLGNDKERNQNAILLHSRNKGVKVIDLRSIFKEIPVEQWQLNKRDPHPNQLGNKAIADALLEHFQQLVNDQGLDQGLNHDSLPN